MKKFRLLIAGALATLVVATPAAVLAEGNTAPVLQRLGQVLAESTNRDKNANKAPSFDKLFETEKSKQTQAERLKLRLAELKTRPTAAELARLKVRCTAGQTKVKTLETKVNQGVTARLSAYDNLTKRLDDLVTKLKDAKVDTAELEEQITELQAKITTFQTDLAKYKLALQDLHGLGCQADPTGFKAALEAARTARATVAADAATIRAYVKDPIKVTLAELKASIDKEKTPTDDNQTEGAQ